VRGDPVRLEQVLVNILGNAARYTPPGGRISVDVRPRGERVEIRIRDTGEGIEARDLERIFELFAQAKQSPARSRGGLGLGLKIVRSLVEMHGGTVHAESAGLGHGSELVVELPVASAPPQQEAPASPPAQAQAASAGQHLRILIVDDNEDVAETLSDFVQRLGHTPLVAHSGPEALTAARQLEPDLVLLDIGLPGLDGYEVARRLRADGITRAPLVAITGYGQSADRARSLEAGFSHHLVKPVHIDVLCALISSVSDPGAAGAPQHAG